MDASRARRCHLCGALPWSRNGRLLPAVCQGEKPFLLLLRRGFACYLSSRTITSDGSCALPCPCSNLAADNRARGSSNGAADNCACSGARNSADSRACALARGVRGFFCCW